MDAGSLKTVRSWKVLHNTCTILHNSCGSVGNRYTDYQLLPRSSPHDSSSCSPRNLNFGLLKSQLAPVAASDRFVTRGIVLANTARQYATFLIEVEAKEERHRQPEVLSVCAERVSHLNPATHLSLVDRLNTRCTVDFMRSFVSRDR